MIEAAFVGFIAAGLAVWIGLPFLERRAMATPAGAERLSELTDDKASIYRSMLDLELDHRLGKISDEDFELLKAQHESEAIEIIRQVDELAEHLGSDELEREIAEARAELRRG